MIKSNTENLYIRIQEPDMEYSSQHSLPSIYTIKVQLSQRVQSLIPSSETRTTMMLQHFSTLDSHTSYPETIAAYMGLFHIFLRLHRDVVISSHSQY